MTAPTPDNTPREDPGFPADTSVSEMTLEEQVAYWKFHARKHEKNRKPADWEKTQADAQKWRARYEPPAQEAEPEPPMFRAALRAELKNRLPDLDDELLDELTELARPSRFLTDTGELNMERVNRCAARFTTQPTSAKPVEPALTLGDILAGSRGKTPGGSRRFGDGGLAAARQRATAKFTHNSNK